MTPEEWAQRVVDGLEREPFMHAALVKRLMSEAIVAAVAEEREACAKTAISYAQVYMSENTFGDGRKCGEQIAAAIRART